MKYNANTFRFFTLVISLNFMLFIIVGCSKNEENEDTEPANKNPTMINDLIPQKAFEILDSLNMPIVEGDNPPDVSGTYIVNPNELMRSTVENDNIGENFPDYFLSFKSPNEGSNSFKTTTVCEPFELDGTADISFIQGSENAFSVFTVMETTDQINNDSFISVEVYTGHLTDEGIQYLTNASIMLNDHGDPNDHYIEINEGRMFKDGNNFSDKSGF
ncbi:MAG: hypothetical protein KDC05_10625 [Bacteroidales bacterium]|nr:hypothetical protein [Bacteroidales bacterium]